MLQLAVEIGPDLAANIEPALAEGKILTEIGAVLGNHAFEQRKTIVARLRSIKRMVTLEA